jgi:CMP-N-acetylneuraminic acid synthetase
MIEGKKVLAVVPARSGSKGIPDKNMSKVGGLSLIARTGDVLSAIPWLDRKIISTDSPRYSEEGLGHGLDAPFLRPSNLSGDVSTALEMILHALQECENIDNCQYDLIIIAEPTSPLRIPEDIEATVKALLGSNADSALTVSKIDTKCHPHKVFSISKERLIFYSSQGKSVSARQSLEPLYSRNGLGYCFRRETLLLKKELITENSIPVITTRPVANIDEPLDLLWAEFLLERLS